MKTKWRKSLCLTLALFLACGAAGCAEKASTVKIEDLYIPVYEDNGQHYRTMADMPPNLADKAQAEMYKAAGFNFAPYTEDFVLASEVAMDGEDSKYIKGLKNCEEVGIDVFIRPHSGKTSSVPTTEPCYFEEYFSTIDFRDYPAVKGFFVVDEPAYGQLEDLESRYLTWFNENYGGGNFEFFANLYGCHTRNWATGEYKDKTYNDYVEKYLSIVDRADAANKTHSIDFYPLRVYDGVYDMYEYNLKVHQDAATRAKAHNVGLGAYAQAFGGNADGSSYRIPSTFAEINWSLYNILSFGATTLKFFCYRSYEPAGLAGMITDGQPNERYYFVQEALKLIEKYDHVLLSYKWDHLFTNVGTGSRSATNQAFEHVRGVVKPITDVKNVKSKYDITMNEFTDADGNKAFMLLNYDEPMMQRNNKVTVTFKEADGVMYYRNGEPTTKVLKDGKFEIDLQSGEGVFVIPLYKK
ncbi:MAG: hypothetical protein IJ506_06605 [Clostridia bacterium]|nr:hypothetical protein [Clostridia bacterium]